MENCTDAGTTAGLNPNMPGYGAGQQETPSKVGHSDLDDDMYVKQTSFPKELRSQSSFPLRFILWVILTLFAAMALIKVLVTFEVSIQTQQFTREFSIRDQQVTHEVNFLKQQVSMLMASQSLNPTTTYDGAQGTTKQNFTDGLEVEDIPVFVSPLSLSSRNSNANTSYQPSSASKKYYPNTPASSASSSNSYSNNSKNGTSTTQPAQNAANNSTSSSNSSKANNSTSSSNSSKANNSTLSSNSTNAASAAQPAKNQTSQVDSDASDEKTARQSKIENLKAALKAVLSS